MCTWIRLVVTLGLLVCCVHGEQEQMQEPGLENIDLATQVKSLQKNVTDLWTYIYQLRQAIELHLTNLTRRQTRLENSLYHETTHSGGHDYHGHDHHSGDHGDSSHRHEPLTSGSDHHHHDEHGSDHHHDEHGSDQHHDEHHDQHGTSSDHHHDEHSSSDPHHEDHGSSAHHHDEHHHHDSHSTSGDHQHGDEHSHHSDHQDEHHHGHHSTSESHSHTEDHSNHSDSEHSHGHDDHHHGDEHHDSHEKADKVLRDYQHSHEHKDSHEKQDKVPDDQQSVEDVEKPFTATAVQTHYGDRTSGSLDKTEELSGSDPLNLLGERSHRHHHHHHHHKHDQEQQSYDTKVTIPKFSEYRQYIFATCDVQPNRVLSPEEQQEVKGQVSFWQKKTGGPLNIHVRLRGFAIGDHHGHQQEQQEQSNEPPVHAAGHRHGMHVHEFGDLSAGCQSTGAHYNPLSVKHGGPKAEVRHVGDLGNIECDDHGVANIVFPDSVVSLTGQYSILGKALVIHADPDDYGLNPDEGSQTTGNAGARIACCVIQNVEKLPLATFKSMKSATNYQN